MPSELEIRLTRALRSLPESGRETERRARRAALDALGEPPRRRGRLTWTLVAAVACVVALATTSATLADAPGSIPDLRVVFSPFLHTPHRPAPERIAPGAGAVFVTATHGRVWVAGPHGMALRGLRLEAPAVSPGALYVVGASGGRLEAVATADRHVAWSRALHGALVGAAWSPYPIRIAYVVGRHGVDLLHVIWGNGAHDSLVARGVAPVTPAWRADSLAFAYVRADGAVALHTIGERTPVVVNSAHSCGAGRVTELAFAPGSSTLAEATDGPDLIVADAARPGRVTCIPAGRPQSQIRWLGRRDLLFSEVTAPTVTRITLRGKQVVARGSVSVSGAIAGIAPAPGGRAMAVAVWYGSRLRVLVAPPPQPGAASAIRVKQVLAPISAGRPTASITWQ